jgi:hypothetical protein
MTQELDGDEEFLSRDDILKAEDMVYEIVPVPEWGGKVRVKGLTANERDSFEASMVRGEGKKAKVNTENIRANLVARTVVDRNGKPIFALTDIFLLGAKSAAAMDRVYEVAMRLSKFTKEDMEELEGNSGPDRSGDSSLR